MKKIYLFLIIILSVTSAHAGDIWVSPQGNDANDGSSQYPKATVAAALRQAREWRRLNKAELCAGGIYIRMQCGVYQLDEPLFIRPEDSGTADSPTVIKGEDEGAVLSGGVNVTDWRNGVTNAPRVSGRRLEIRQLYVNGERAVRAVQFAADSLQRMIGFDKDRQEIWIPTPKNIEALKESSHLEMLVHQRWAVAMLRVKDLKAYGDSTRVRFYNPESRLEFEHPWPQPVIGGERGNSSFCLMNALPLLDEPGEWFQNLETGEIHYLPKAGQQMQAADVVAPVLERLVTIDGTLERPVEYVKFENLSFQYSAWLRPSQKGHVTLQAGFPLIDAYKLQIPGLPEKTELENQAWVERPQTAIDVRGASHLSFDKCGFLHIGSTALDFAWAVQDISVTRCRFEDIGGTAVMAGAFPEGGFETHVPYKPVMPGEICRNIHLENNYISNASAEDWGCPAVSFGYVADTDIVHNEVCHVNYSGICVGWGWIAKESIMRNNHIRANYVHDFGRQLYDVGGIYTLSNQPGSSIAENRIEDLADAPYATNNRAFYIYLDEATDGFEIRDNWMPDGTRIGDNRPGASLKWGKNGANVSDMIRRNAGIQKEKTIN